VLHKTQTLLWLNLSMAVGMATSVFTGQLRVFIEIGSLELVFPASNVFFAFMTFPVTDVIADVIGKRDARLSVWIGLAAQIVTVAIIQVSLLLPGDTSALEPFALGGWRVLLGSTLAYLTAQLWDIWIFHWIKERFTGDGHLWLRNNVSTCTSQTINSGLFIAVVFGLDSLPAMLLGSVVVKWAIAFVDTPFVYLVRSVVRSQLAKDHSESAGMLGGARETKRDRTGVEV